MLCSSKVKTMFKCSFVIFTFLIVILNFSYAQEGDICITPLQQNGFCINIKFCSSLLNILKARGATSEVTFLLKQSHCGWIGKDPLVCCPQTLNQVISSTEHTDRISPPITERTSKASTQTKLPTTENVKVTERTILSNTETKLPRLPNCGINNVTKYRIVNGVPALLGEYPWMVALGYRNARNPDNPKWLCGGSMITDRHVLTAGHCIYNRDDLYLARIGELDLYSDDDGAQAESIPIASTKLHEEYNPISYTNDIAIVTLATVHNNPTVRPVCLPIHEPLISKNYVKTYAFVAGWGALYFNGPTSAVLQTATIPVVANDRCSQAFINFRTTVIDNRILCAGYIQGGKDACQGDSGGPLMFTVPDSKPMEFYQIGVVSYGFRCAEEGFPGVYTRITSFMDWIEENVG